MFGGGSGTGYVRVLEQGMLARVNRFTWTLVRLVEPKANTSKDS